MPVTPASASGGSNQSRLLRAKLPGELISANIQSRWAVRTVKAIQSRAAYATIVAEGGFRTNVANRFSANIVTAVISATAETGSHVHANVSTF